MSREDIFFHSEITDIDIGEVRVTDTGRMALTYRYGGKERTIPYGYIEDNPFAELIKRYYQLIKEYLPR